MKNPPDSLEIIKKFWEFWNKFAYDRHYKREELDVRHDFAELGYVTGYDQGWKDALVQSGPMPTGEDPTELEMQQKVSGG